MGSVELRRKKKDNCDFEEPEGFRMDRMQATARVMHVAFIAGSCACGLIVIVLSMLSLQSPADISTLAGIVLVFGLVGACCLAGGAYLPKWLGQNRKGERLQRGKNLFLVHILRISLFESVAIFGVMTGVLGIGFMVGLPFVFAGFVALVLSFPTDRKWRRMMN